MDEDYQAPLTNREKIKVNKGKSWWCFGCDANRIWAGQKCDVCGSIAEGAKARMKPGKFKAD